MVAAINKPVKKVDYTSYYAGAAVFMLLFALTLYFVLNRETPSSTEPSPSETNKLPTKSLTPLTETNKLPTKSLTPLTETNKLPTKSLTPLTETNKLATKSLTPLTETNKLATKSLTPLTETNKLATKPLTPLTETNKLATKSLTPLTETNKLPTKSLTPLTETNKLATKSLTSLTETVNELVSYTPNLDQVIETGVQNSNIKGISKNEYKYMRNKVLKESKRLYPCKKMGGCTPPAFEELLKEKQLMDNNDIYGIPRWCSQDIDCKGFHPNSMCEQNMCSLNGENSQSVDQNLSL